MKRNVLFLLLFVLLIPLNAISVHATPLLDVPPYLSSASIQSPENIWYTGGGFTVGHWDGQQFQHDIPPLPPSDFPLSGDAILSFSPTDTWVIGSGIPKQALLVSHLVGRVWTAIPAPNQREAIHAMAAASPSDIWAVGHNSILGYDNGLNHTYTMHWNGQPWAHIPSPTILGSNSDLNAVTALTSDDVWVVGYQQKIQQRPLIEHWNGKQWRIIANPILHTVVQNATLTSVTAIAHNNVWVAGNYNQSCVPSLSRCVSSAFVAHWNGNCWKNVTLFPSGALNAISARTSGDVWAVGHDPTSVCINGTDCLSVTFTEHWDGGTWTHIPSPTPHYSGLGENGYLLAVRAFSLGDVWAIGHAVPPGNVFLEHWDGQTWQIKAQATI